jgi:hypothetical protein
MKRWQPHIDLQRLCEAAQAEILAASDEEVRQGLASGLSAARAATEIRNLIAAATGDLDERDRPRSRAEVAKRSELLARQH